MIHPDVVVVGVGRSGTSYAAYVLQERLGVCMAHNYEKSNTMVEGGFPYAVGGYEELCAMMAATQSLVAWEDWQQVPWLRLFTDLHENCKGLVGIKQTRLAAATLDQWKMISPKLVVRTFRPSAPTVKSMVRWRQPKDIFYWDTFYREREQNLVDVVDAKSFPFKVVRIDYSQHVPEEMVIDTLLPHVEDLRRR